MKALLLIPFFLGILCVTNATPQLHNAQELIPFESVWFFNDDDVAPDPTWVEIDFDHTSWDRGSALLGYDTSSRNHRRWPAPGLQTALRENLITYYFRKEFEFSGDASDLVMFIEQIIDDGAVYYLNGVEIARSALMPDGPVTHSTTTRRTTNPQDEHAVLEIVNPPLRHGRNVMAVSVHNFSRESSDICFGARVSLAHQPVTPLALYLTWQRDPTTTMTIQWHTDGDTGSPSVVYGNTSMDDSQALTATGSTHPMPYSERLIHTVELTGLEPDSKYYFALQNLEQGRSSFVYYFRTMPPEPSRPIRVVIGGDLMAGPRGYEEFHRSNALAATQNPDFIVWGGDLAYVDGRADLVHRWHTFFEIMMQSLITPSNRIIPVLYAIGNHEIRDHFYWGAGRGREAYRDTDEFRLSIAPYFYNLFAFPSHPGYGVVDFGDYLSIILLDSDHSGPIEGNQTKWLESTLRSRSDIPHVFPIYHVPGFPSFRPFDGESSVRVREHWVPLFEDFGVELAFEFHDHTYKRTFPILNEQHSDKGIIYIGDGAWGVPLRPVNRNRWYIEKGISTLNLILVSLHGNYRDIKVLDSHGNIIDHLFERSGQRSRLRE